MMFGVLYFMVVIALHGTQAQEDCTPDDVKNVTLDLEYTLQWEASTNCDLTQYQIYILIDDDLVHIYNTDDTHLNVSFLPACQFFHFQVRAYSGNRISNPVVLSEYTPAPSDADLTITNLKIILTGESFYLEWQVPEKFAHCARAFRIIIRDEWYVPTDIYTQDTNITLDNLVPCGDYEFGVMAIYNVVTEGPVVYINYKNPAANLSIPVLESVEATDTYVDLKWSVSPYSVNRCPITSFVIDGSPYFDQTYPIQDSPARPPITTNVPHLKPDTMYFMRAYVVNSAGRSDAFQISVQTLPAGTK